jgi:tetratricopeptide (TPR) repeat protein
LVTVSNKMSNLFKIFIYISFAISVTISNAQEYEPWTGSVTGATIHFGTHDSLKSIRRLINEGKTTEAVQMSEVFVRQLSRNDRSGKTVQYKYDAYNALCLSLTADKQFVKAISACDEAIEHSPKRWQAYNSRGSLNYKYGKYSNALNDYKIALENAPNQSGIRKIIEHNIKLSQSRVSNN